MNKVLKKILTEEDCKILLLNYTNNERIKLINFELSKLSDEILGYLGDHFLLKIIYKINDKNDINVSFFVKTLPQFNNDQNNYVQEMGIFEKELLVYKNLISKYLELSSIKFAAKPFYMENDKFIILEHLQGYEFARMEFFDINHCLSLMRCLASFHSATIIYEEKYNMKLSDCYQNEIKEATFSFVRGHVRQKWCESATKCLYDCFQYTDNTNIDKNSQKLKEMIFEGFPKILQPSKKYRNVLVHDDLHNRNIMFNKQLDCVLVDFQLVRYIPPAMDVLLSLFLNTEPKYLDENFNYFLNTYYSSFSNELKRHHLNIDNLLPKSDFIESINFYKLPALIEAAMCGTNVYLSDELSNYIVSNNTVFNDFTFINRSKYITKEYMENSDFRNRFNCVLLPLIKELENNE